MKDPNMTERSAELAVGWAEAWKRFENRTAQGVVESCDWVRVEGESIKEIRSFYDTAKIREVLSTDDQESLDGYD